MKTSELFNAEESSKKIKTLKEENKMKKKTIITIISIITILVMFSSISYANDWVNAHNEYRGKHSATPPVSWSPQIADRAQAYANTCPSGHSTAGSSFRAQEDGENMAWGYSNIEAAVEGWYVDEQDNYNNHDGYTNAPYSIYSYAEEHCIPGFGWYVPGYMTPHAEKLWWDCYEAVKETHEIGHFTQVVWKSTTHIGCGYNPCSVNIGGQIYNGVYVCQYSPNGNVLGQFGENVGELKEWNAYSNTHAGSAYNAPAGSYNVVVYDKSSNPIKVYSSKTSNTVNTETVPSRTAETLGTDNAESMTGRIPSKGVMGLQAPTDTVQKVTTASKTRSIEVKTPTKVTATKKIATKTKVAKKTTVIKAAPKKTLKRK